MAAKGGAGSAVFQLFKAIESGDTDAVRGLLEEDPGLADARNPEGASALLLSTYYRRTPISDLLLSSGARPDIFDAAAQGLDDRVAQLARSDRALGRSYSHDGWTPLHLAAHFGRLDVMKTLLANGADHRAVSRNGNENQSLQAAAAGHQTAAVELLLKAEADAGAATDGGKTALEFAIEANRENVVDLLEAASKARPTRKAGAARRRQKA